MSPRAENTESRTPVRIGTGCTLLDLNVGGEKGALGYPSGKFINIIGDSSSGKAQPLASLVLTPTGFKKMGEIKVGDNVISLDGTASHVLGVFPQGKQPVYEFTFSDGSTVRSASSHLWKVQTPNQRDSDTELGAGAGFCLVTTKQIVDYAASGKLKKAGSLCVPSHSEVEFEDQKNDLPLNPYLLGFLIAEGGLTTSTVKTTNPESDLISRVSEMVSQYGCQLSPQKSPIDYSIVNLIQNHKRTKIAQVIQELGLHCKSITKFVPYKYLHSSVENRKQLLIGMFDGDGYVTKGGYIELTTSSNQLAIDIAYLVRSLGGLATTRKKQGMYIGKDNKRHYCEMSHTVSIRFNNFLPFSSEKHISRYQKVNKKFKRDIHKYIKSCKYVGRIECQCIYIDHPQHCYITDGFTVTHNTFICCEIIASAYHKYGKRLKFVYDDAESGFTFNTKALYGFEILPENEEDRFHSGTVQEMAGNIRSFLKTIKTGEFGIYVVDSLDGLSSEEIDELADKRQKAFEKGSSLDKGSYQMQAAKYLSQEFFRTLTSDIADKHALIIFVSQIRYNVDPTTRQKWTRAGGKALDFFAYSCLWLRNTFKISRSGRVVGAVIEAESKKLKASRGYRKSQFVLYFDYGIDDIGSNIDYLNNLRGVDGRLKKNLTVEWEGSLYTRPELIEYFETEGNPEDLRQAVIDQWEEEEEAVRSNRPGKYNTTKEFRRGNKKDIEAESRENDRDSVDSKSNKETPRKRGRPPKSTD